MKILLLGPNGQLGTDIQAAAEAFPSLGLRLVDRSQLDVSDVSAVRKSLGAEDFDAIINCTSYHKTDEAEDNAQYAAQVNGFAVQALGEVCAAKAARLVHISTDYVFSGVGRDTPYEETDGVGPINVYGASKVFGESLARLAHDDTIILRVASLFGVAGASGKGGNFVETMIRVGRERGQLRVVDDVTMSPTGTADVAQSLLSLLHSGAPAGTYHAVNAGAATWFDFAQAIIGGAGVNATVEACTSADYPTKAVRPAYSVLSGQKLATAVAPMPPWQEALDRYLRAKGYRD